MAEKTLKQEQKEMAEQGMKLAAGPSYGSPGRAYIDDGSMDPSDILRQMKVEEQEREEIRRMKQDAHPSKALAAGTYDGAGGYKYEVMPEGSIKIVQAPGGQGVVVTLRSGHPAFEAISEELTASGAAPITGRVRQGEADILAQMQGDSLRREEEARRATGVDPTEKTGSGREMARVLGLSQEEQMAEMKRMESERGDPSSAKLSGPRMAELSPEAQQAFDRTKAKLAERS